MAVLRQKTKAKKAEIEARAAAAEARRAAHDSAEAVRDLAQALMHQFKQLGLDEKTNEAISKLRSSDAYGRAQAKADELSKRVAESDAVTVGRESAVRTTGQALAGLGAWLAAGQRGKRLGISNARRGPGGWAYGLLGVGIGYAIGLLTAPKQGRELREELATRAGGGHDGDQAWTGPAATTSFERPLEDKVRTRLGEDPRTSHLPKLNINAIGGTVVVRGAVPEDADRDAIEAVVAGVDGVEHVDIELGSTI